MAKKNFKKPPTASAPTAKQLAFAKGGAGTDRQEPTKRVSVEMPKGLHNRFKSACALADIKMGPEILTFIEKRTKELENAPA